MNANANSSFNGSLRGGPRPSTAGISRKRGLAADDKENLGPNVESAGPAGKGALATGKGSRMQRPKTAAAIQQSMSPFRGEAAKEAAKEEPAEPEEPAVPEHPLAVELKQSDVDHEGVLNTKIPKIADKGSKGDKLRMEAQKNMILKLRETLTDLLGKRDTIVSRFVEDHEAAAALKQEADTRIAKLEAHVGRVSAEMAKGQAQFTALDATHKATVELNAQAEATLVTERAARAAEAETAAQVVAERDSIATERDTAKELAASFSSRLDSQQMKHDSELEALRTQLGQEMVASHENKAKYTVLSEEFAELKTKFAVMEEAWKASKAQVERLQQVETTHKDNVVKLQEDKDSLTKSLFEMQARMDAKEMGHAEAVKGMVMGQELQVTRIKELEASREEAQAEAKAAKGEADEAGALLSGEKMAAQQAGIELRLAETHLAQVTENLAGKATEAENMRVEMAVVVKGKSDVSEALAVLQTEYSMYKKQIGLQETQMDQIEKLCKAQAESVKVQQAKNATEADLMRERAFVDQLKGQLEEAKSKLLKAESARRKVFNELQEIKGNIRTFCRLRPASRRESHSEGTCPITMDDDNGQVLLPYNNASNDFKFDRCFDQSSTQADVFDEVKNFVQSALDGYNVSLLAYGQTGAGKTHTMLGATGDHRGIIPRSIEQILTTVQETAESGWSYTLQASFLEIYNESIRDLLVPPKELEGRDYTIRQGENGMMAIADLKIMEVTSTEDVERLMATAEKHKTVKGTDMNERSSRSHTVFQLRITATRQLKGDGPKQTLHGSLNLVDLAGSERLSKSCATGDRLKETQSINKSLSALGDVFTAISKKQNHVPFRNSKLTFLLQPCLSGDGKALVLMALSPADTSAHESLCTLRFSSLISQCELGKATKHMATEGAGGDSSATGMKRPSTAGPSSGMSMLKKPKA